jgi:hypothetical protein
MVVPHVSPPAGKTGPKRTPFERERDRSEIARLYLTRMPQAKIAELVHLSPGQVNADLAAVRKEWLKARVRNFDADLNRELARIDALEVEYWEAWRGSKLPRKQETTQQRQAETVALVVTVRSDEHEGNPQFLAGVQWCIDRRIKLLGIDAPLKIAPTNPEGDKPYESLTDAERTDRLVEILERARARRDGSAPGDDAPG